MAPTATNANDDSPKAAVKIAKSVAAGLDAPADATRELPFAYTTFSAPPPLNAKNAGSSYLKADKQAWTVQHPSLPVLEKDQKAAARASKRRKKQGQNGIVEIGGDASDDDDEDDEMDEDEEEVVNNNTIVVHLGSSELRIGLATDLNPLTLPNCLARRDALVTAKRKLEEAEAKDHDAATETRINNTIEALRADLRSIMRNLKLRGVANGKQQAANYNAGVNPETLDEHQDIYAIEWTEASAIKGNVIIGEDAEKLPTFSEDRELAEEDKPWKLFYPIKFGHFNFDEYSAHYGDSTARAALLNDINLILSDAITSEREVEATKEEPEQTGGHGLGIPKADWKYYNIALIVPDIYLTSEVEALVDLFLQDMGFAGIMLQQESVCATFGAGQSSACVVHAGSTRISVTCVDEGLVVAESRQLLGYGGLQCSQLFAKLLQQANFPYKAFDANKRLADRWLADELKERLCTLDPFQLGLIISDFHVRLPGKRAQKYALRTYDEVIVGAMGFFKPQAFAAQAIPERFLPFSKADLIGDDDSDGAGESGMLPQTQAMRLSVPHLLPALAPSTQATEKGALHADTANTSKQVSPAPAAQTAPAAVAGPASSPAPQEIKTNGGSGTDAVPSQTATPVGGDANSASASARVSPVNERTDLEKPNGETATPQVENPLILPTPVINVPLEASRTHLDLAVWNSILASASNLNTPAASEERIKRMITSILCTGGSALLPGLGMAIEARLNNYVSALWTSQNKDVNAAPSAVAVPPPRDMDPRIVPWKGMAVLTRLDNHVSDLWLIRQEWQLFGMRALRERTYFMP